MTGRDAIEILSLTMRLPDDVLSEYAGLLTKFINALPVEYQIDVKSINMSDPQTKFNFITDTVFTDSTGRIIKVPSQNQSGLFLGSTAMGYYDNSEPLANKRWKTFMSNTGNFYLNGTTPNPATDQYLKWESANLEVRGKVLITNPNDFARVDAIKTFYQAENSVPTGMKAGDFWFKTDKGTMWRYNGASWDKTGDTTDAALNVAGGIQILTGGLIINSSGFLKSGKTAFNDSTNAGYYIGTYNNQPNKPFVYFGTANDAQYLTYDETGITLKGGVTASAITTSTFSTDVAPDYFFYSMNTDGIGSSSAQGDLGFAKIYQNTLKLKTAGVTLDKTVTLSSDTQGNFLVNGKVVASPTGDIDSATVRSYFSGASPIVYNQTTGQFSWNTAASITVGGITSTGNIGATTVTFGDGGSIYRNYTNWLQVSNSFYIPNTLQIGNNLYLNGDGYLRFANKANSGWLVFATRDTSQTEARYNLGNIGTIQVNSYIQIQKTGLAYFYANSTDNQEAGIQIQNNGVSQWTIYKPNASTDLRFYNSGGDAFILTQTGALTAKLSVTTSDIYAKGNSTGYITLRRGDATNTGYIEFFQPNGTRAAYIGYTDGTNINFSAKDSSTHFRFSNGSVGIGTIPTAKFEVDATGSNILSIFRNGNGQVQIQADTSMNFLYSVNSGNTGYRDFGIKTNASVNFFIKSSTGNVGVGIIPTHAFHVYGSWQTAMFESDNSQTNLFIKNTGTSGRIYNLASDLNGNFSIQDFTASGVSRIIIDSSGKVCIGTITPKEKFHVNVTAGQNIFFRSGASGTLAEIYAGTDDSSAYRDLLLNNSAVVGSNKIATTTFTSGAMYIGSGWRIDQGISTTGQSTLEIDNILARGTIRTNIFQQDVIKTINGGVVIGQAGVVTSVDSTNLRIGFSIEKSPDFPNGQKMWFKDYSAGTVKSVQFTITSIYSTGAYEKVYNVTVQSGALSDIPIGATISQNSGNYIFIDASTKPIIDIYSAGALQARYGDLSGITDGYFGALSGFGLYAQQVYLTGSFYMNGGYISWNNTNKPSKSALGTWTTYIDANGIYTGTLTADQVNAVSISATSIKTGTLDCSTLTVSNLSASAISAGTLSADRISGGTLDFSKVTATNMNVTGTFQSGTYSDYSVKLNGGKATFGFLGTTFDLYCDGMGDAHFTNGLYINGNSGASRALYISAGGKITSSVTTGTELGYLNGVTGPVQTQLDGKSSTTHNHNGTYSRWRGSGTSDPSGSIDGDLFFNTGLSALRVYTGGAWRNAV